MKFVFAVLILVSCKFIRADKRRPLNSFIRHFHGLNYDTKDLHHRTRRAISLSPHANVELKFKALNKDFALHLRLNQDIFTPDFGVYDQDGKRLSYDHHSRFYAGSLEDDRESYVSGKIVDGKFHGTIQQKNDQYYIEPAERYFGENHDQDFHSVMYSARDTDFEINHIDPVSPPRPNTFKSDVVEKDDVNIQKEKDKYKDPSIKSRVRRGSKNRKMNTCNLKVVADHLFMEKFVRRETAIDQMVLHYQAIEYIFRNQTFNVTQYGVDFWPQGIGFRIKEVHVWNKPEKIDPKLNPRHISIWNILELFSETDHSSVCQAVLFTDRSFDHGIMGLAYVAFPYGQPGGICEKYIKAGDKWRSYNAAVVTFRMYNREAPLPLTEITLAHEMGHALGAQHDPVAIAQCAPPDTDPKGKYIMWEKSTSGFKENNRKFSECSITSMIKVINAKGLEASQGCFVDRQFAICGNGAHEEGEICDCGTIETCEENCCIPLGKPNACHLANEAYECSPSRGPCCLNATCTLAREFEKCYDGTECRKPLFCDGLHYWCPAIEFRPNNTLCDKDRSVCENGYCSGSLCKKYNLESCLCEGEELACHTCCMLNGVCTSSYNISIMPNMTKSRGTPCNYYEGYCDALGQCNPIDMDGPLRMLYETLFTEEGIKIWFAKYWYVVILGSILILLMLTVFVYYCQEFTPTNNPILMTRKKYKPLVKRRQVQGYSAGGPPIGGGHPIPFSSL